MTNKTKWILSGVAALVVSGALFAMPALAEERGVTPFGPRGFSMMGTIHGAMGGDMQAMHNAMAPLMSQMPAMHEQAMGEVAGLLNMTIDELNAAMAEGKTLAELADEQKVAPGQLQSVMTRNMKTFLDSAVKDGTLTREQANQMFQLHQQHSTDCISGQSGMMGGMHGMMFGTRGQ